MIHGSRCSLFKYIYVAWHDVTHRYSRSWRCIHYILSCTHGCMYTLTWSHAHTRSYKHNIPRLQVTSKRFSASRQLLLPLLACCFPVVGMRMMWLAKACDNVRWRSSDTWASWASAWAVRTNWGIFGAQQIDQRIWPRLIHQKNHQHQNIFKRT